MFGLPTYAVVKTTTAVFSKILSIVGILCVVAGIVLLVLYGTTGRKEQVIDDSPVVMCGDSVLKMGTNKNLSYTTTYAKAREITDRSDIWRGFDFIVTSDHKQANGKKFTKDELKTLKINDSTIGKALYFFIIPSYNCGSTGKENQRTVTYLKSDRNVLYLGIGIGTLVGGILMTAVAFLKKSKQDKSQPDRSNENKEIPPN